ncbi:hypothetical protein F53441_14734, partial [Fusarium austroafricanum]
MIAMENQRNNGWSLPIFRLVISVVCHVTDMRLNAIGTIEVVVTVGKEVPRHLDFNYSLTPEKTTPEFALKSTIQPDKTITHMMRTATGIPDKALGVVPTDEQRPQYFVSAIFLE